MPDTPENYRCFGHTCLCGARWMFTNEHYGCNNLVTFMASESRRQCTGRHIATCPECARSLWDTQSFLSTLVYTRLSHEVAVPAPTPTSFWQSIDAAFPTQTVPQQRCTCAACGRR